MPHLLKLMYIQVHALTIVQKWVSQSASTIICGPVVRIPILLVLNDLYVISFAETIIWILQTMSPAIDLDYHTTLKHIKAIIMVLIQLLEHF